MSSLLAPTINVAALVAGLVYVLRAPMKEMVKARHEALKEELESVRRQLLGAQEQYEKISARLKVVDAEVRQNSELLAKEAAAEKITILDHARKAARGLVSDVKSSTEIAAEEFKVAIRIEFAQQVISKAEAVIRARLTGDDRLRIRTEFSKEMERVR